MNSDSSEPVQDSSSLLRETPGKTVAVRLWPAVVILIVEACALFLPGIFAKGTIFQFLGMVFGPIGGTLALMIWWLFASRAPWKIRGIVLVSFLAVAIGIGMSMDPTMGMLFLIYGIPLTNLVWVAGLGLTSRLSWAARSEILVAGFVVVLGIIPFLRMDGTSGSLQMELAWRWQPRPEDAALDALKQYERSAANRTVPQVIEASELAGPSWAEFRGPRRDSRVAGIRIETDWSTKSPVELWRRPVGPGWSSFAVVGNRAYTQEQRGDDEAVVCYDTSNGAEVWAHVDKTKFNEAMGGVGPRATPTVVDDVLYALGANGTLNCLETATGRVVWATDIAADTGAEVPRWGFASSPLVVGDLVVVYAGAYEAGMIAYDRHSGEKAWACKAGNHSYSSPQLARLHDTELILMMSNAGLAAADVASGSLVWEYDWSVDEGARIVQPGILDDGDILIATGYGKGTHRISPVKSDGGWTVRTVWESRNFKPYFNDFVCHGGYVYGFDDKIMACIDPATGDRVWKGGRYGYGQVLLLTDQNLLLVLSERGDVAVVEAKPDRFNELAKFHAMDGKTWNHPVVVYGKLFVRNAEEAVCYELPVKAVPSVDMLAPEE